MAYDNGYGPVPIVGDLDPRDFTEVVTTAYMLYTAITTSEWFRYEGNDHGVSAGTTGPDAIDLRAAFPTEYRPTEYRRESVPIEYRHVGADDWLPTGYAGRVSYDVDRSVGEDTDGYRFYPYQVTDIQEVAQ